jgi:hypothetical protein
LEELEIKEEQEELVLQIVLQVVRYFMQVEVVDLQMELDQWEQVEMVEVEQVEMVDLQMLLQELLTEAVVEEDLQEVQEVVLQ